MTDNDILTLSVKFAPPWKNSSRTLWPCHRKGERIHGTVEERNPRSTKKKKKRKLIMAETCFPWWLNLQGWTKLDVLLSFDEALQEGRKCKLQTINATDTFLKKTNWQYKQNQKLEDTCQTRKKHHAWEVIINELIGNNEMTLHSTNHTTCSVGFTGLRDDVHESLPERTFNWKSENNSSF